jgi:multidrug resistance efflux pump
VPNFSTRRWWLISVALLVGLAGAAHLLSVALRGNPQPVVTDSSVPGFSTVVAFGHIDADEGVSKIYPTVPAATVSEVPVKQGDSVPAGSVLVRLDDTAARKTVDEAKAALEEAKAARDNGRTLPDQHRIKVEQAQNAIDAAASQRDAAKLNLENKRRLLQSNTIGGPDTVHVAEQELRQAEKLLRIKQDDLNLLKLVDPNAQVKALEAQVARAEAALARAGENLKQYTLVAPKAGTVLQIGVSVGDTVGGQPAAPAIQFCPDGPRVVRADIEQAFAASVAANQRVTIQDDTHAAGNWTGRVKWVADWYTPQRPIMISDPNQYSDVRTMPCVIELDTGQPPLKINQRVRVIIEVPGK